MASGYPNLFKKTFLIFLKATLEKLCHSTHVHTQSALQNVHTIHIFHSNFLSLVFSWAPWVAKKYDCISHFQDGRPGLPYAVLPLRDLHKSQGWRKVFFYARDSSSKFGRIRASRNHQRKMHYQVQVLSVAVEPAGLRKWVTRADREQTSSGGSQDSWITHSLC